MDRDEMIADLVANDCCLQQEDLEPLNDQAITNLHESMLTNQQHEVVANAARLGFEDTDGSSFSYDEDDSVWNKVPPQFAKGKKTKKVADDEEDDEEEEMEKNQLTSEQEEAIQFANNMRQELKDKAVASITANTKQWTAKQLQEMPLDMVQGIASAMSEVTKNSEPAPARNFIAAAGSSPPQQTNNDELDQEDNLPLPIINWADAG